MKTLRQMIEDTPRGEEWFKRLDWVVESVMNDPQYRDTLFDTVQAAVYGAGSDILNGK